MVATFGHILSFVKMEMFPNLASAHSKICWNKSLTSSSSSFDMYKIKRQMSAIL